MALPRYSVFGRSWDNFWEDRVDLLASFTSAFLKTGLDTIPSRLQAFCKGDKKPQFKDKKDQFQVMLNMNQFNRNEINVKIVENYIVIHGKHDEKPDAHGFVQREFTRRYLLPEDVDRDTVTSSLSENGILTIKALRKAIEASSSNERPIPIRH